MIKEYKYRDLIWVDLESPSQEEIRHTIEEFHIHPLIAHELSTPSLRPKVDLYQDFIYLILHFPEITPGHEAGSKSKEVDFIIGRNFIVTTRFDAIDPLHQFSKIFEVNSILDKSNFGDHAGFIFYYMICKMYESLGHELDALEGAIISAEERIFRGEEREMVIKLSRLSRTILDFKRAIGLHREVLESFEIAGRKFFGPEFDYHMRGILGEYLKVDSSVRNSVESILELRETNDSLLNTKQNEIMKTLTIMAFIFLPLSFIAALYSMETDYLPLAGQPNDFWIITGLMFAITIGILAFFKRKGWL